MICRGFVPVWESATPPTHIWENFPKRKKFYFLGAPHIGNAYLTLNKYLWNTALLWGHFQGNLSNRTRGMFVVIRATPKRGQPKKERRNNRSIWWNYTPETMVVMRVREMYNSRGTVHTLSQYKNTENLYTIDALS